MFSNDNELIVSTNASTANIYNTETGQLITTLKDPNSSNNYKHNCASFNPTDDLVLSDGILWDLRTSSKIHKFDKFNNYGGGKFHPNGLEIIINSEIWDVRTFRLLRTCSALDQTQLYFNTKGDVMFGVVRQLHDDETSISRARSKFGRSFRTIDAVDYTPITTVHLDRNIIDMACNSDDSKIAVIEVKKKIKI